MSRKAKTTVVGVRRSLGAAANPDAVTVEDVLAAFASGTIDANALYQAYAASKGVELPDDDATREMIAGVVAENSDEAMPGQDGFDPALWADLIHDARQLEGPSDQEIVDDISDETKTRMQISTRDHALAVEMGRKLSDDFQSEVATTVRMDIRKSRLPITMADDLIATFDLGTILHVFPRPGSKGRAYQEGNRHVLFDRYKLTDDAEDKFGGDFYREMYLATPQGMADAEEIKWGKAASEDATDQRKLPMKWRGVTVDGAGNPEPLSAATCKEMMTPAVKRISTGTQLLRRTVGYLQAYHLIKAEFPAIIMSVTQTKKLDDKGNPVMLNGKPVMENSTGTTPIQMYPHTGIENVPDAKVRRFSPDSLAKLFVGDYPNTGNADGKNGTPKLEHIRKLISEGMTQWSAVMGAIKRKPKGEGATGKGGTNTTEVLVPAFTSHEFGRQGLMELAAWFTDENGDMIKDRHAALLTWLNAKGDDRKDRVLTVGRACIAFTNFWPKIEAEYNRIQAEMVTEQLGGVDKAKAIAERHNAEARKPAPKGFPQPTRKAG